MRKSKKTKRCSPHPVVSRDIGYGVMLSRHDEPNGHFLAYGMNGRFISITRKGAVTFRDELKPHVSSNGKVVKIEMTCRLIGPANAEVSDSSSDQ